MSFATQDNTSKVYAPGWFLADAECDRRTQQISSADERVVSAKSGKYMPMGTIWPSNDGNAVGITYEDVDVTSGDMPGSVVMSGSVYEGRLPVELAEAAKTALQGKGFKFLTEPTVTRP